MGAAWLALCLPLLAGGPLVAGGTGSPLPLVFALAATAYAVTAGVARMARRHATAVAGALFLVLASAGVDTATVEREEDLASARFGLPFDFVEAQLAVTPPLPADVSWNPWEDPARLLVTPFLASSAAIVALALVLVVSGESLFRRRRA